MTSDHYFTKRKDKYMKKKVLSLLLAVSLVSASVSPALAAEFSDGGGSVVSDIEEGGSAENELSTSENENTDTANSSAESGNSSPFSDSVDTVDSFDSAAAAEESVFSDQLIPDVNDYSDLPAAGSVRDDTVSSSNTYNITVEGTLIRSEATEFVRLVNEARAERGLDPVTLDQEVQDISEQRAIHVSAMFGHGVPDGNKVLKKGYGEVLSARRTDALSYFNGWKASSPHWNILMRSDIKAIGYAVFKSSTGVSYAISNVSLKSGNSPITYTLTDENISFSFNIERSYVENNYMSNTYSIAQNKSLKIKPYFKNIDTVGYVDKCYFVSVNGVWESSNPRIATVDNEGNVTALSPGTTTIKYYINGIRDHSFDTVINVKSIKTPVLQAYVPRMSSLVKLKWNLTKDILDNGTSMGYQIFVYNQTTGKYELYRDVGMDREDFDDEYFTNLYIECGTTKKIKIRLYENHSNGEKLYGDYSNAVTISTAPGYVKMKSVTMKNKKAYLKWTRSENADGYVIFRRIGTTGTYKKIKTINSGDILKYTNSKLTYGKKYCYKVKAFYLTPNGKKMYTNYSNTKSKTCR